MSHLWNFHSSCAYTIDSKRYISLDIYLCLLLIRMVHTSTFMHTPNLYENVGSSIDVRSWGTWAMCPLIFSYLYTNAPLQPTELSCFASESSPQCPRPNVGMLLSTWVVTSESKEKTAGPCQFISEGEELFPRS